MLVKIFSTLFNPNFPPIFFIVCWCCPLHFKKHTKLIRFMRREKTGRPIQNKLKVKKLIRRIVAQKIMETSWEIQKIVTFAWLTYLNFLDLKTHSYSPFSFIVLFQHNPTSFLPVKFLVTQKSRLMKMTVDTNVPK